MENVEFASKGNLLHILLDHPVVRPEHVGK